ncbi:MAG TPA: carboxypeptidase-like regulatory domain-containing protein, partial [Terriglobia bacterium]|nr:carboxypeptidase-like regulatory domain-containing protein [Terriglobia bacterium]
MKPILLTLLLAIAAIQNPAAPGTGTIEGRVLRAGSGEPAANMPITLIESSGISEEAAAAMLEEISNLVSIGLQSASQIPTNTAVTNLIRNAGPGVSEPISILTDRAGHFEFPNLRKGRYTIWVQRQGYFGPSFNGVPASVSARTIAFDPAQPAPVDVVVTPSATITGRILDSRGRPVSGAVVRAFRPTYDEGRVVWESVAGSQATDDIGEYRIPWLPPGDYYLSAQISQATPSQTNSARTFYPGTTQAAEARKLTVDSGETRGIDISVQTGQGASAKISGVAINPNSTTGDRSFPSFFLVPRDFSPLSNNDLVTFPNMIAAADRQNGEFELRNVPPGIYDLFPVSVVAGFVAGRTFVNVRNADAEGVRVNVTSAVNLPGTIVVNGSAAQSVVLSSIQIGLRGFSMPPIRGNLPANLAGNAPNNSAFPVDASGKFIA